ncbi:MAG: bifunctional riboflavin kinase/FAD synthetase [Bacteroidetes bacterium]|nr:bifunctional riboflavin kinase/FAD synthetase [Bacteroidota bacterium]
MKTINNLNNYKENSPLVLSIGMFDGVHLGHQSIIHHLKEIAAQIPNSQTAILTFWPHPRLVFNPKDNLQLLNTIEEKSQLLKNIGIDLLFLQEFDEEFRNLNGEDFVRQILVEKLKVCYLVVGHDHVFGKNKSGDFSLLQKLAPELGYKVEQMKAVNMHNDHVSSTKIRLALQNGNTPLANEMLGYSYSISGKVIHGKKIGRTIGFPTANIEVNDIKLLPQKGAYIVEVELKNQTYKGMLSIGTNPTVNGVQLSTEVFILDFNQDIYGENIKINFKDYLHAEIKFDSLEQLIDRLKEDETLTRQYFS